MLIGDVTADVRAAAVTAHLAELAAAIKPRACAGQRPACQMVVASPGSFHRYQKYAEIWSHTRFMRWSLLGSKMVRRTCLDCGESWTLDRSLAHLKGRPRNFGPGLPAGWPNLAIGQEVGEQQMADAGAGLDQHLETVRQLRTCSKCGSDNYKDTRA